MFAQTWNKYIPVIRILIKKSAAAEQVLQMNSIDFLRAAGGKKIKLSFDIQVTNGRLLVTGKQSPLAKEFALLLQEDEQTRKLIREQQLEFCLKSNFQLFIRNKTTPPLILAAETLEEPVNDVTEETADNIAP
jgi:hypothetical protein